LWLSGVVLLGGCASASPPPTTPSATPEPPRALVETERALVQASNDFGIRLFREASRQAGSSDVSLSPLSVSLALGMAVNGAAGDTETEMARVLGLASLGSQANQASKDLVALLLGMDASVVLEIANSIWYRNGLPLLPSFLEANQVYFDARVAGLDFGSPAATDTINAWVKERTHGRIPEILGRPLSPLEVILLLNAVYFKGDWAEPFDPGATVDAAFHAADGDRPVKMMERTFAKLPYLETEDFQAVDLPYGLGHFRMAVFLPKPGRRVEDWVAKLDGPSWSTWMGSFADRQVRLSLPRFTVEYDTSLVGVLKALGMVAAFDDVRADFSRMSPAPDLYLSEVMHKTYVRVDEKGSEAAAVTGIVGSITSFPIDGPVVMRVERPFVFVIHDRHSAAMLFSGRIGRPVS
jgi:serpin B